MYNITILTFSDILGTDGNIVVISSESAHRDIQSASLDVVNRGGNIIKHINLTKGCEGGFISDTINFPYGSYSYHLVGTDIGGIAFEYDMKQQVTFHGPDLEAFSFKSTGVEMDIDGIKLDFNLINHWTYDLYFDFSGNAPEGFAIRVDPLNALIVAGGSAKVQMLLRVIHSSIWRESLHTLSISASTCSGHMLSTTRVIAIVSQVPWG